ncbi:MAG: hypothetical protein IJC58_06475 [Oscillospiraceae bacterium]|nr:hypothetical protein [Oscillospiraceae bacterium]
MKCPYCQKEMEIGIIPSPQEISWLPGEKSHLFNKASLHKGSVLLSEFSALRGSCVKAHLCRQCEKIMIDCQNETGNE